MDLQLGDQAFSFDGTMNLSTMNYNMLNAGVPNSVVSTMLDKWFHVQNAGKYLPQKVDLRFSGPASALKLDNSTTQKLIADVAKQQGAEAVSGLLSGGKGKDGKSSGAQSGAGSLIDALTGKKDNTAQTPAQGQQTAPRQQQQQAPASQPIEQGIGGLIDMLGGNKEKK
jgi:hypothetical protein